MANLGFTEYADCEPDVNYVLMDDLPQWQKDGLNRDWNYMLTVYFSYN